jgi:chorismate mutase/prephenate dehydratase
VSEDRGNGLSKLRKKIDGVDDELIRLVAERMELVQEIGIAKSRSSEHPVFDPERERELVARWSRAAEERGLPAGALRGVLREILEHSRRHQEARAAEANRGYRAWAHRIGYQGEPGAYSDLAIQRLFPIAPFAGVERVGYPTFSALFDALGNGAIDCALVPAENTTSGSVPETAALLIERRVCVLDEEVYRIEHVLAALPGAQLPQIKTIRSHPVALQQCRRALSRRRGCAVEPCYDTAGAARALADSMERTVAVICSEEAALHHGLAILIPSVADHYENYTRFLLVARSDDSRLEPSPAAPARAKTSIVFSVRHERGALAACLGVLADHGINLTRIESCPKPGKPWEYQLLLDLEGHDAEPRVKGALADLGAHANHIRVLGSYNNRTHASTATAPAPPRPAVARPAALPPQERSPEAEAPSAVASPANGIPLARFRAARARSVVTVRDVAVGGERFVLIAGPCAVESRQQILDAARMASRAGAQILRGGAFKPRTSPYSFQGLGDVGLDLLAEAGDAVGLPVVTEVLSVQVLERVAEKADMLQVGARNMQNFELLRALGKLDRPVILKRGMSATIEDLLNAAEYILAGGNQRVVLCERGIRTFETATRSTLDIAAVPVLRARTHLPIIVDPSHAAGKRELVIPLALAAAAAGADGLIVEAHPRPEEALSDREQALGPEDLVALQSSLAPILAAQGRGA